MSSINGMKQFQTFFGLAGAAPKTGLLFGIYTIGSLIGAIFASYLPDKVGRVSFSGPRRVVLLFEQRLMGYRRVCC